jgi:outer membrane lipoprotein carrier protein
MMAARNHRPVIAIRPKPVRTASYVVSAVMVLAVAFAFPKIGIGASMAPMEHNEQKGSPALRSFLRRLQRHYQQTESFTANFTEKIIRTGGFTQTRQGTIDYKKPGRIRWQFSGDQPETIVSNGKTIYDYDPGLDQVVETPLNRAFKTSAAAAFMLGVGNLERDFNATDDGTGSNGLHQITLVPKGGGDGVELGIDPATLNIEKLTLKDALGNTTVLHFTDIRINPRLNDSLFEFKVPPGADVVSAPTASHD